MKYIGNIYLSLKKQYDWIAFLDVDEFLTFADGCDDIHRFLGQKKFLPYQLMHIYQNCQPMILAKV